MARGGSRGRAFNALLVVFLPLAFWLGPRLMDGAAAVEWTRFHVAQGARAARPADHARGAARAAAQALDLLAPLPMGADAVTLALGLGRQIEAKNLPAAHALYLELRVAIATVRTSSWRGFGLDDVAAETSRLEEAARAKLAATAVPGAVR